MDLPQRLFWNLLGIFFAAFVGHNVLSMRDVNRKVPATRQSDDEDDGGE